MNENQDIALGMNLQDWNNWLKDRDYSSFRSKQIMKWIFDKKVTSFSSMTTLSKELRKELQEHFNLSGLKKVRVLGSLDTTSKFLFSLNDSKRVETVLIPANLAINGKRSARLTCCVSSQVGCAYGCKFCASGMNGFVRNLSAGEIVGQVMAVEKESKNKINNVVFMGMGEPLANFSEVSKSLSILNSQLGMNIGARNITISTSGLAPEIEKLSKIQMQIRLAISLHGVTNEVRNKIMPINKKYPLDKLFQALEVWNKNKKQMITFEYILLKEINDSLEDADKLANVAKKFNAKINLIPYNKVDGMKWEKPPIEKQRKIFQKIKSKGVFVTLREKKGDDIAAACGQLNLEKLKL